MENYNLTITIMRKIRQNNDIDIKVYIKDKDSGRYLDPTSCRDISIRLQTASKKVPITDFVLSSEGHIDFRFHAKDQTRIGVYTIVISATTDDGRVFTTDVCDAFALVACSCEAGGESEIKVETLDLTAEFAITAWGSADEERIEALEKGKQDKIEDLNEIRRGASLGATALQEYYDDGSHEVVPVKHPDLSTQPSILPYKFAGNYVYEQMVWCSKQEIDSNNQLFIAPNIGETVRVNLNSDDRILLLKCDCIVADDGSGRYPNTYIKTDYKARCFQDHVTITFNDLSFYDDSFIGCWFRLQYCLEPKDEYYYAEENKLTFTDYTNGRITYLYNDGGYRYYSESGNIVIDSRGKEQLLQGGCLRWEGPEGENVVYINYNGNRTVWYKGQPLYLSLPEDGGQGGLSLGSILGSTIENFIKGDYVVEIVP
jgi:hypothetical protein